MRAPVGASAQVSDTPPSSSSSAPLLLATSGGSNPSLTCMPLAIGSAFAPTKEILERACVQANHYDADPDLDVGHGQRMMWSTHSLRRLADTVARRYMDLMGVSEDQIDIYFGWHEKMLLKEMQRHYEQMSTRERMTKAKITRRL